MRPDHEPGRGGDRRDDHERYANWDAAYSLGALAPAERREYEAHLAGCEACQRLVAELTPTVALLSRVHVDGAGDAESALRPPTETDDRTEIAASKADGRRALVDLARHRQRRSRRRAVTWAVSAVAAAALVVAVTVPILPTTQAPAPATMVNVAGVPLEASVLLDSVAWGTRIDLACSYPSPEGADKAGDPESRKTWTYQLAVVDTAGEQTTLSTWKASAGTSARLTAGTALEHDDIAKVQIRSVEGDVLMELDVTPSLGAMDQPTDAREL